MTPLLVGALHPCGFDAGDTDRRGEGNRRAFADRGQARRGPPIAIAGLLSTAMLTGKPREKSGAVTEILI